MADGVFDAPLKIQYSEPAAAVNFEEFRKVVASRRSVRVYRPDPIPEDVVEKCLDMALLAPNSSNLQPWEFHWVRSPEPREKLVRACLGQPAASTAPVLIVCVARTGTWRRNSRWMLDLFAKTTPPPPKPAVDYYRKLMPFVQTVGPFSILAPFKWLLLNGVGLFRPMPRSPISNADLKLWAHKSTALACENLMLAFRAAGFDSCPMEGFDSARVGRLLNLPRDASVVMVISAGRRDEKSIYGPQLRFDRKHFIHYW